MQAQRLEHSFKAFLSKHNGGDLSVGKMIEEVMMDTTKEEDWSKLPGVLEPDLEHQTSSAFVDCNTSKVSLKTVFVERQTVLTSLIS